MRPIALTILITYCTFCFAQSVDQIKAERDVYIWGEGKGSTIKKADQDALDQIISQISISLESKFTHSVEQNQNWGSGTDFKEKVESVVNTYSNATLNNTERIVENNEPDAVVFRYIKKADVNKVFEQRKKKINDYVETAIKARADYQISDALRYFYWALILLQSHPDSNELTCRDENGNEKILITWLPAQLNDIFSKLRFSVSDIKNENDEKIINLDILYNSKPVSNFDYTYWIGNDWTPITSAKDGLGVLEFLNNNVLSESVKLKAEYVFESEARMDKELEEVMKKIEFNTFPKSYFSVNLKSVATAAKPVEQAAKPTPTVESPKPEISAIQDSSPIKTIAGEKYQKIIEQVIGAITSKNYASVNELFTSDGFKIFDKLVHYGNAKVLDIPKVKAIKFNNRIMCRQIPMVFSFSNNSKKFVENLVFEFNEDDKISGLTFSLQKKAFDDIADKTMWNELDRLTIVDFLEQYKTAYALERIDYIESIFASDAVIIVGRIVKIDKTSENKFAQNRIVQMNRFTKEQYIRNLKACFNSNEYINVQFENTEVIRGNPKSDKANVYGITLTQSYYSSSYGDKGYLYLQADLSNPSQPIIHVRTWQPEKNPDGSIYGMGDF